MSERYPGYLFGGTPVSSWERNFNPLENQIQAQYRRHGARWGSMSEGGAAGGDSARTNLIVNYLPQTVTEKDLYAMFTSIGPIESCRVMKDYKTGYSYGFGFVNFTREEDAARAIDTFNGYQLRNKRLKVSYARPSGDDIKDTNLYVTNLPRAITDHQLETIFGKYGRIVQKHILRDKANGSPRGVAFVRFDKREEAQEAIAALNNVIPEGGTEPLSVKSWGSPRSTLPVAEGLAGSSFNASASRYSEVAEEHGKQKAAYYAGWSAGFHQNRGDFSWGYGVTDAWPEQTFATPPHPAPPHPATPRNGYPRSEPFQRPTSGYQNYPPKVTSRAARGRNFWMPGYGNEERFKAQRIRNVPPSPYW